MEGSKVSKKETNVKRRQMFKPLLSNPYVPHQIWTKIDHKDQLLILDLLTHNILTSLSRWNALSKEEKAKEIEKESNDMQYGIFKDRNLIVTGYNTINKLLEEQVKLNLRKQKLKGGVLFVSKSDMVTPLLYQHFPMLCALADVKLIQIPKGSSQRLGRHLNLNKDVSLIFVYDDLIKQDENLKRVMDKVEVLNADILTHLQSTNINMKIKFQLTDVPIKKK